MVFTLEFSCLEPHADAEPPTAPTDSVGGVSKLFTVGGNGEELNNFTYRGDTWRQQWGVSNATHGKNGGIKPFGPKRNMVGLAALAGKWSMDIVISF